MIKYDCMTKENVKNVIRIGHECVIFYFLSSIENINNWRL